MNGLHDEIERMVFVFNAGDNRREIVRDLASRVESTLAARDRRIQELEAQCAAMRGALTALHLEGVTLGPDDVTHRNKLADNALASDAGQRLLERLKAAEDAIDKQCWEHADNCLSDWCASCKAGRNALIAWRKTREP